MFVVRRPFKSIGKVYTAGSVITEPAEVKRFKGKVAEGKIIEVTEQTYDSVAKYFKEKYDIELPPLKIPDADKEEASEEVTEVTTEEVKTEEAAKVATKTVAKASVATKK